jgi:hypothetical protein
MQHVSRRSLLPLAALAALAASDSAQQATLGPTAERKPPLTVVITPITGTDATANSSPSIANLDAGDLVAGRTWWEIQPGLLYLETLVGFLWDPAAGMQVFEVSTGLYFSDLLTAPVDIARDRTVVGGITSTKTLETRPFRWTPAAGFGFLELPAGWQGGAVDVSDDGLLIGGSVQPALFAASQAARWNQGVLAVLGPAGQHSFVSDGSDDGSVLVGEIGASAEAAQATRWIDGVEVGLAPVPGAASSHALFVSGDGQTAIGRAVAGGQERLVRWTPDGSVATFAPPAGLLIETLNAINADGSAVVGALSDDHAWLTGDWVPFVWRAADGFHLIDALGMPDAYDRSEAIDVSDDGQRVVGNLSSWVFSPSSPPARAFLWTETTGTLDLDLLQQSAGGAPLDLSTSIAISGTGNRILVSGAPGPLPQDTGAAILAFQGLP